ncbi:helix-turn-helix domain-containing protein [Lentilactobacillus senioris]|uniref:helix-turn-helix domain-containing protein n=1 Tax=Lentilactobacillus senioris TaxID=931534 RepID=UPI003D2CD685
MQEIDVQALIFSNNRLIPRLLQNFSKINNVILYIVDVEGQLVSEVHGSLDITPSMIINDTHTGDLTVKGVQDYNYQLEHTSTPLKIHSLNKLIGYFCCAQYIDKSQVVNLECRQELKEKLDEINETLLLVIENLIELNLLKKGAAQFIHDVDDETEKDDLETDASEVMVKLRNTATSNKMIITAIQYIDENLDKHLTLDKVASRVYLSTYYFSKLFHKEIGLSFSTYLSARRIQTATEYLKKGSLTVKEVSSMLNFPQVSYFSQTFKKYMNCTPTQYKKKFNS